MAAHRYAAADYHTQGTGLTSIRLLKEQAAMAEQSQRQRKSVERLFATKLKTREASKEDLDASRLKAKSQLSLN